MQEPLDSPVKPGNDGWCGFPIRSIKELRLLIGNTTNRKTLEQLAEGLNLQDCDKIINYDLHGNPVPLIQRFGRIDRIGSEHDVIYGFNFLAEVGIAESQYRFPRDIDKFSHLPRSTSIISW